MKKTILILSATFLIAGGLKAQIVVDSLAINDYVQDVLLGAGVQASNISYTGCLDQFGYMHEGESVGLDIFGGVVLSSEIAENIEVPSPWLSLWNGTCTGVSGDADLVNIANSVPPLIGQSFSVSSANDIAVLEFDFVPTGDTLSFEYIFGSNEYLEWVNTGYNDIFAFFLSGPGITGPYDSPAGFPNGSINIAILPDSDPELPITISSVNSTLNSDFYIDNPNHDGMSIDGYTVTLTAWSEVVCGETYHIKLAIADGSDTALESIVILEEGSFSSNAVVDVVLSLNVGGPDATTIYEDCGEATLTFTRAAISDLNVQDMVLMTYTGDAENGIDYTLLPDTIYFPIGVETVVFSLDAFEDGLTEGLELVHFDILNIAACNGSGLTTDFEFWIGDHPEPLVVEGYETEICLGDTLEITPIITGGYGNFQYDWSTGEITESILVAPDATTSYNIIVSDTCGMPSDDADILVNILVYPPLDVEIDIDALDLDCGEWTTVYATATGGDGFYNYYWYDDNDNNLWGWMNSVGYSSWNGEGEINVEVTDGCGFTSHDVIPVTLNIPDLVVDVPTEVLAPCGLATDITALVSGGGEPYYYTWMIDNVWQWDWDQTLTATYSDPVTVQLTVQDNCGQLEIFEINVTIDSPPIELELIDQLTGNCLTEFDITPDVSAGSGTFSYSWTEGGSSVGNGSTLNNFQSDATTTVNLLVTDACGATATDDVIIEIINPAVLIEVGEDITSSCITTNTIDVEILNGAGAPYSYQWFVDGTPEATGATFDIQTYQTAEISVLVTDACTSSDDDAMTIIIPDVPIVLVTSADTAVCANGSAQVWALATGGEGGFIYEWTPGGQNGDVLNLSQLTGSNTYTVTATDICGDEETASVQVLVMPITADFTAEEIGASLFEFIATPEPACDPEDCQYTYLWDFGDDFTAEGETVEHQFDGFAQYTTMLTVVNEIGCTSNAYYLVTAPVIIYIPNSFTPNGDGINDVWLVQGANIREFELLVFNRWGDVVFQTTDVTTPWIADNDSGEYFVPNGVYNYLVKVKGYEGDAFKKSGSVTVLR